MENMQSLLLDEHRTDRIKTDRIAVLIYRFKMMNSIWFILYTTKKIMKKCYKKAPKPQNKTPSPNWRGDHSNKHNIPKMATGRQAP